jgi:hypothetical protein
VHVIEISLTLNQHVSLMIQESTLDLCNKCYNEIQSDIDNIDEREDLRHDDDILIDWEDDE